MLNETDSLKIFVVEQILSDVLSKELKAGDTLLSKRQLALKYNVSRTVIDRALDYLVEQGYFILREDGLYQVVEFNRYKDIQDLINFSKYKNQAFTEKEIEEIRQLKAALDLLSIKLVKTPINNDTYQLLKNNLSLINLSCSNCENKNCANCATIIYNFYSQLAQLSNNTFLNLLYLSFKDTNITIISYFFKNHNISKLYNKALAILECLHQNKKDEAIKLLDEEIY